MNTPKSTKWIPKQDIDVIKLFDQTRQLEKDFRAMGKKFTIEINFELPDYYEFDAIVEQSRKCFELSESLQINLMKLASNVTINKKIERSPYKILQSKRSTIIRQNLKRKHFQLIFIINKIIKTLLRAASHTDFIIDAALILCTLHNDSVESTNRNSKLISGAQVCSNSFPTLLLPPKKIDIGMILQTISKNRSEQCCLSLITCLLTTCKSEQNTNNDSDTSSIEILKALTVHLSSPLELKSVEMTSPNRQHKLRSKGGSKIDRNLSTNLNVDEPIILTDSSDNDSTIRFFDKMTSENIKRHDNININYDLINNDLDGTELLDQLIADEENYIANILLKCLRLCASSFDKKPSKAEIIKWVNRGTRSLWTQVGSTLEHVVLWWSNAPLACRPVTCTKHLRDWLLILQADDAPEPILSTLRGLGETLTVYVANTLWDKQFRLTLVSSILPVDYNYENTEFSTAAENSLGTTSGRLWSELLFSLTTFCNSCDQNGTIPDELPIVEQIPILHRLDHSIHSMRLWVVADKAKTLCTDWNMKMFFKVVQNDVDICLHQLNELRVPELVKPDAFEVLVQVCVALRAKLVSEIKVNINKLKQTYAECIDVLASICRTISLATLSLCFPSPRLWQIDIANDAGQDYVKYFLDEVFLPVLQATGNFEILSLILKIMCEAWLDHIYNKKIKFSRCGAVNLLKDFDGVAKWITTCQDLSTEHIDLLAKHEVLRMCEGVGKILLRKPDEIISMDTSPRFIKIDGSDDGSEEKAPLPPEMFVPNQQRWLELRARNRQSINCLCLCVTNPTDI